MTLAVWAIVGIVGGVDGNKKRGGGGAGEQKGMGIRKDPRPEDRLCEETSGGRAMAIFLIRNNVTPSDSFLYFGICEGPHVHPRRWAVAFAAAVDVVLRRRREQCE